MHSPRPGATVAPDPRSDRTMWLADRETEFKAQGFSEDDEDRGYDGEADEPEDLDDDDDDELDEEWDEDEELADEDEELGWAVGDDDDAEY
ncbi:MAG: hypothetical protein ACT4PE_16675 [Candidatus Eiseniibacteriota bacterium]